MANCVSVMKKMLHLYNFRQPLPWQAASFFFGARIWLGTILGRFSINYFGGLGLRIRVRVRVWVRVGVRVRVSVVIWSV